MSNDDEAARKARAKQLQEEIDKLVGASKSPSEEQESSTQQVPLPPTRSPRESPREFIHRRMREERQKEGGA
jgi:hypothetical protein